MIQNGQILEESLRRERVTLDELIAALRRAGVTEPSQVRLAVLGGDRLDQRHSSPNARGIGDWRFYIPRRTRRGIAPASVDGMNTIIGAFTTRTDAEKAARRLFEMGIPSSAVNVLVPGRDEAVTTSVPTTEAEAPGVGGVIGGVAGAAAGAATGIQLGTLASFAIPGIGPIVALGVAGAALLGFGGAKVGEALDHTMRQGVPKDDLVDVQAALRRGRAVVVALVDPKDAERARAALDEAGAEPIDAAPERRSA